MATLTALAGNRAVELREIKNGVTNVATYALADLFCNYVDTGAVKVLSIFSVEGRVIELSDQDGFPGFGNTVLGSTLPATAHTTLQGLIGVSASGGGGGGGTSDATAALQGVGNTSLAAIDTSASSLDAKVVTDKKVTIVGVTATATLSNNLLSTTGASTDVTSYKSAQITIVTAATSLQFVVRGANQAGFTSGVRDLQLVNPDTGAISPSAITQAANTSTSYLVDLSTVNFLRFTQVSGGVGSVVTAVFSKEPIVILRSTQVLDPLVKQQLEREAGTATTSVARQGGLPPAVSDFSLGNSKISRLHFVNYSATQLFIQFHNSAANLVSGVSVPTSPEVYPITGVSSLEPGLLLITRRDWDDSGNWGVNSRVAISTTRSVYTAPPVQILNQTTLVVETTPLV